MLKKFQQGIYLFTISLLWASTAFGQATDEYASIIKVWGYLKYQCSDIAAGNHNWDKQFIHALQITDTTESPKRSIEYLTSIGIKGSQLSIENDSTSFPWLLDTACITSSSRIKLLSIWKKPTPQKHKYLGRRSLHVPQFLEPDSIEWSVNNPHHRLLSLARYWNIIEYFYPYKELLDNWDAVLKEMIPVFLNVSNEVEYYKALLLLNSKIKDSHAMTNVLPTTYYRSVFGNKLIPDIALTYASDTIVIAATRENITDLKKGDILIAMDNIPVHKWIDSMSTLGSYSFRDLSRMTAIFHRSISQQHIWTMMRDTSLYDINVSYEETDKPKIQFKQALPIIPSDILYINADGLTKADFRRSLRKNKSSKIILDLRCYPSFELNHMIAKKFSARKKEYIHFSVPNYTRLGTFKKVKIKTPFALFKNQNTLVALVSEKTKSAAESLVMSLQTSDYCIVMGLHTAAANGDVVHIPMPGGYFMPFSSIGVYYPNGSILQHNGVSIDYPIHLSIKEAIQDEDPLIHKAIQILKEME
jgi:carboxyl-terminal processing protease